jgi:ribosome-associated protein
VHRRITISIVGREAEFLTSRSSGPGGQNVNKVNSKVTIKFDVPNSQLLTAEEKEVILNKLSSQLTKDGVLIVSAQDKRSQLDNKEAAIAKFEAVINKAFVKKKTRKATKPSKGAVQKRIKMKKEVSEKKKWRQRPDV